MPIWLCSQPKKKHLDSRWTPENHLDSGGVHLEYVGQGKVLTWMPCSPCSMAALSCHTPHPTICLMTSSGGPNSSNPQPSPDPSQAPHPSKTIPPSQMPAQALALASPLARDGMLGTYFQIGSQKDGTLDGPKQLALNPGTCHLVTQQQWH